MARPYRKNFSKDLDNDQSESYFCDETVEAQNKGSCHFEDSSCDDQCRKGDEKGKTFSAEKAFDGNRDNETHKKDEVNSDRIQSDVNKASELDGNGSEKFSTAVHEDASSMKPRTIEHQSECNGKEVLKEKIPLGKIFLDAGLIDSHATCGLEPVGPLGRIEAFRGSFHLRSWFETGQYFFFQLSHMFYTAFSTLKNGVFFVWSAVSSFVVIIDNHGPTIVEQDKDESRESSSKQILVRKRDCELDDIVVEEGETDTVDNSSQSTTEISHLREVKLSHNFQTLHSLAKCQLVKSHEVSTSGFHVKVKGLKIVYAGSAKPREATKAIVIVVSSSNSFLTKPGLKKLWLESTNFFDESSFKTVLAKFHDQTFCDFSNVVLYRPRAPTSPNAFFNAGHPGWPARESNSGSNEHEIEVYLFSVTSHDGKSVNIRTFEEEFPVEKHFKGTLQHEFEFQEPASIIDNYAKISDMASDPPGQQSVYIPPGDVRKEAYRLSTFDNFPRNVTVSIVQLAKQGFHYTGYHDRVKCYSCGRTIEKFEPSDAAEDQRYHKSDCLMAQGRATDNIPIGGFLNRRTNASRDSAVFSRMVQNAATTSSNIGDRLPAGGTAQLRPGSSANITVNGGVSTLNGPLRNAAASSGTPRQWRLANIISSDHRRYLTNLHLNREIDRLATFSRWPTARPNVAPVDVAKAGFFYLGDMDRTQCFSCGGVLRNWTRDDNAMDEHRTHFGSCRFVLGTDNRNVPVPIVPETQAQMTANYPCQHPTNPHMRSEHTRLATFDTRWPSVRTRATPEQIAEAGFFYLGERDRVKCWYCNGGLQNWEYDDIPWVEHAKWFPSCQFLLRNKGQQFVYRHLSVSPHLPRPVIGRQAGSTIDPVQPGQQRGQDIPPPISRARAPTPPPTIIDPQEEMRRRKEEVDKEIRENVGVRIVIDMGFDEEVVRKVLEERLEYLTSAEEQMDHIRTKIFDNTEQLLNAVQGREAEIRRELEEEREATRLKEIQQSQEPMSIAYPSVSSNYSTFEMSTMETAPSMASQASGVNNVSGFNIDSDEEGDIYGSMPQGANAAAAPTTTGASLSELQTNYGLDITEDPASIKDMIERKKEEGLCKICFTEPADMVFMPCSHMCCCKNCTEAIRYCPVCRKKISRAIKTYLK